MKIRYSITLLICLCLSLAAAPASAQSTRYVAIGGNDFANDCLTETDPCATLTHAIDQAVAFDTVQVGPGEFAEMLDIDRSLSLIGAGSAQTIVQAFAEPGQAAGRVIFVGTGHTVEIGDLTIRNGNISSGSGQALNGAGLYNDGAQVLILRDVVIHDNRTSSTGRGGGMFSRNSNPVLTRVEFIANLAFRGGGLYNENSSPDLTNVQFRGNSAQEEGGGMYNITSSDPTITNALFAGNFAGISGGGVYNHNGCSPLIVNASFSGNRASNPNQADGRGGGMRSVGDAMPVIANSIFWNNQDDTGIGTTSASLINAFATVTSITHSLVQGCKDSASSWNNACGVDAGNNLVDQSPRFVSTPNPTTAPNLSGNLRLLENSPAIDVGDNAFIAGTGTDLDGFARIINGIVDLGPFEFGSEAIFHDRFEGL